MNPLSLLRDQDGLISHDQCVGLGLDRSYVRRRVETGDWCVVHPRVYRDATHLPTPRSTLRAAALWAGDDATLIGHGACSWWGLTDRPVEDILVAVGPRRGHTCPPGIVAVRRTVSPLDRELRDGVWVVRKSFAALEAAVGLGLIEGARLLDRALLTRRFGLAPLGEALEAMGQRHGVVLARRLVELARGGARSEAERDAVGQLVHAGVTGWLPNMPVDLPGFGPVLLDLAFPRMRLAVEIDGWAYHRDVDRFRGERRRQNEIVIGGWRVIRVTWYDLQESPTYLVDVVRRSLALAALSAS